MTGETSAKEDAGAKPSILGDRRYAAALFLGAVFLVGLLVWREARSRPKERIRSFPGQESVLEVPRVELNSADREELELLPGVGSEKAKAIMEWRKARGGFRTVWELEQLGFTKRHIQKLLPLVEVSRGAAPGGESKADTTSLHRRGGS